MRRLVSFPALFLLALGCLIAAVKEANLAECADERILSGTTLVLLILGGALAFASVAVPWFRYIRADGGRIRIFELSVGVVGGLLLAGASVFAAYSIVNGATVCD